MRRRHTFKHGDRVHLRGDKHQRPWRVMGFPSHGTTILIQRENHAPSSHSQAYYGPDDLRRLPEKENPDERS